MLPPGFILRHWRKYKVGKKAVMPGPKQENGDSAGSKEQSNQALKTYPRLMTEGSIVSLNYLSL